MPAACRAEETLTVGGLMVRYCGVETTEKEREGEGEREREIKR